jgi:hypothetical protein
MKHTGAVLSSEQSSRMRWTKKLSLCLLPLVNLSWVEETYAFQSSSPAFTRSNYSSKLFVSEVEKVEDTKASILKNPRSSSKPIIENGEISTYESMLLESWDANPSTQKGFDWEIEKLRRNFAGLRLLEDGSWAKRDTIFDLLVNKAEFSSATVRRLDEPPKPVSLMDVLVMFATNLLANIGFADSLGMAKVPDAVIQKYEGSFFSFIKGALGGDLQTLAGGPLFLILAKYYTDYGPIFNLSFGPKSFLVVSDPVMARHILRESSPDQYRKGMLAEILEPIMGNGLIPADPAMWKVSNDCVDLLAYFVKYVNIC